MRRSRTASWRYLSVRRAPVPIHPIGSGWRSSTASTGTVLEGLACTGVRRSVVTVWSKFSDGGWSTQYRTEYRTEYCFRSSVLAVQAEAAGAGMYSDFLDLVRRSSFVVRRSS